MGGLKGLKQEQIQMRDMSVSTFMAGENAIIIEGIIKDSAKVPFYRISGEKSLPGVYHHMVVRWLVDCTTLRIVDLEIAMPEIPMDECLETKEMIKNIIGTEVTGSLSNNINYLFGGIKGCAHVKSLLLLMGSTALQGYILLNSRDRNSLEKKMAKIVNAAKNTCYVWREQGDLYNTYGS